LLEESGAISSADVKKAVSNVVSYQDSVMEQLNEDNDEDAVLREDKPEDPDLDNRHTVDMSAICKVVSFILVTRCLSHFFGVASKNYLSCSI
jgi:hypothetical protein